MIRTAILALLLALSLASCSSGPPERSHVPPARSPEEIAERLLVARRRGSATAMWDCFEGPADRRRVYRGTRWHGAMRTWREFQEDVDLGWENPPLAPATVWERIAVRRQDDLSILVYRQGTGSEPDRGLLEIAARPVGSGWLVAWVEVPR